MMLIGMKLVTREKAKVDRIACPWQIRKFVDPDAEFLFVPADQVFVVAKDAGAIPFDVKGVELGHRGDQCRFDAIIGKYRINDEAILELARIMRGADTQAKDLTPYSRCLKASAGGFRRKSKDEFENMKRQFALYDALKRLVHPLRS